MKLRERNIDSFSEYFLLLSEATFITKYGKALKILTPKQIFQKLPIELAQVKADNTSKNLLSEIRQIIYPLYRAKEITKKVCNKILHSIKL